MLIHALIIVGVACLLGYLITYVILPNLGLGAGPNRVINLIVWVIVLIVAIYQLLPLAGVNVGTI